MACKGSDSNESKKMMASRVKVMMKSKKKGK